VGDRRQVKICVRVWSTRVHALHGGRIARSTRDSQGTVTAADGWHTYAADHLTLMDDLGHRRFHVMGGCIGASFCLTLCKMAPRAGHRRRA
jgi:hypothetical protein